MGLSRLSISTIGAAVACVFLLLAAPAGAAEGCTSSAMYIAAHEDDTLLFESPALLQDVQSEHCVRTVFLTAGDAGRAQSYWGTREDGAEAAYAKMAGVANQWTGSQIVAEGHSIHLETLNAQPGISIAYLRLPDGGTNGEGFPLYGSQSLPKLWRGGNLGSPSISSITAVDSSATYTYQGLIDTLAALMDSFEPRQVVTQNYTASFIGPNHPDHVATGYFVRAAHKLYADPHRLSGYLDYESSSEPQNIFGSQLTAKQQAFYEYGKHDSDACASEPACASTSYAKWLLRQYAVGTETTGVVAHAGYLQTTTASTSVTLDGSKSSDQSGKPLSYAWTQTGGPTVWLSGADTVSPSFTTPSHPTLLTFSLVVKDGSTASPADLVRVRVPSADPTPVAIAGSGQTVASGASVSLDGSESWDPNSLPLQYSWAQTAGPAVALSGAGTAAPSFTAPTGPATLKFALTVSNGTQTSTASTVTINVQGVAPSFSSGTSTTFTTGVAKSFTVSTAGSPTPAVEKSAGSLPTGLSFKDNGDGTATISGTADSSQAPPAGTKNYPLTFKATNGAGEATQSFTLTVSNPGVAPSFGSATSATFTTGVAKSFTVSTAGSPTPAIEKSAGSLPTGLSFKDNGDGTATISGTADSSQAPPAGTKNYPLTFKATNGAGEATQAFTLTVSNPGVAPSFSSGTSTTFTTGVAKSFTVSTSGSPTPAIEKSAGSLPTGLSFKDNGDGTATISGTAAGSEAPPAGTKNYPLTFKATNGAGEATQSFTLTVSNPGVAPSFSSGTSTTFTTGVAKSFTVSTSGSPTPAIEKAAGTLPSGLTFKDNGDGTATISGTADASQAPPAGTKNYALTFKATNGAGEATQAFTLTVSNPGVAPSFSSGTSTTFTTGVAKSFTVSTSGSPTPAVEKSAGSLPTGLSFKDNGDGTATISGTADASQAPPAGTKNYPLTFKATNGAGEATQSFTLTVSNPGVAPSFSSATSTTFTTGVAKSFTVSTAGSPTPAVEKAAGTLPSGLSFKDNDDGTATISGTADASQAPPAGTKNYALTFKATNGAGEATQSFTLTVSNPGVAPSFGSATAATFTTGVAKSFTVSTSGSPTPAVEKSAGSLPTGLSFKDNGDGTATISGTADSSQAPPAGTKNYPLTFKATNGAGEATQSFTLTVSNPGVAPSFGSATAATFTTGVAKSFTVSTSGSPTPAVEKSAGSLPTGLTFKDNGDGTATISGTADSSQAPPAGTKNYALTFKATNGAGEATQPFTLTVSNPGVAPSFSSGTSTTFTTGVAKSFTVSTSGSPTPTLKSEGTLPTGLSFKDNGDGTATISGSADASQAPPAGTKNYPLTFKATNGAGEATQSFTLTVSNPGVAPSFSSATSTTFTTGVAKSFTVSTAGSPTPAVEKAAGTLPSGLSFKDNGDGTATISGTAAGSEAPPAGTKNYALTFKATNGAGEATQPFTLTVSNPGVAPSFSSATSTTFTTGVAKSFTVSTAGSPTPAIEKSAGSLPTGLSFKDNGDGTATISGTADSSQAPPAGTKNYALTFKATNGAGEATQSFTLTVSNPGVAPSFGSATAATFTTGVAKSFTVSTAGSPTPAIEKSAGSLPTGLSFKDNGDGTATISGTADSSQAPPAGTKNYALTFKATNGAGEATQSFTLSVSNPGSAPHFTSEPSVTFTTGVAKSFTLTTSGAPTPVIARAVGSLPSGLAFEDNGDGTATISGTAAGSEAPPAGTKDYPLTFEANSGAGSHSQSFTLTVSNPGVAPSFGSATVVTFTTGVARSFTVSTAGSPTPAIEKSAGSLPTGLSFKDNGDGTATISGTADSSQAPPAGTKNYALTFKATNGAGEATQSFTLSVSNPGSAPHFASEPSAAFTTSVAKSFTIVTTGSPSASIQRIAGTLPAGLAFTDNGDGTATVSGTADPGAAPPGQTQGYDLAFKAGNAVGSAVQAFSLTVTNPEEPLVTTSVDETSAGGQASGAIAPAVPVPGPLKLSTARVQLPVGKPARRIVRVLPSPVSAVECEGSLPRGARCRVTARKDVVVESSRAVKGQGTYRLTVHIADGVGTVRLPLIVQVQRQKRPALGAAGRR